MPPDENEMLTRAEVLGGLSGREMKRAGVLLFAIETCTSHLVARTRWAMERFLTDAAVEERELDYIESFALGREPFPRPSVHDIERHANRWASLVPESPEVRAALARLLGSKYGFTRQAVPGMRAALGLDDARVQQAYRQMYREPLDSIFAPGVGVSGRLRGAWEGVGRWVESLPPFWTAFALTLTETVGGGVLALPIALAGVGPIAGVVLLVVLGLVNTLTVAFMAEAITRSGTIRYGNAFVGRVVSDYLGRAGAFILSVGIFIICFIALLAYYVGFSTTMADTTGIQAEFWVMLLFLAGLYFVRRESLNATVVSALAVGVVNIALILIISALAFMHMQPENLLYVNVPFLHGRPFDPSILRLVFGVVLAAYFGHLSVSNCAKMVLRRDPGGRSLLWGTVAAQLAVILLYSIWVMAINGALEPHALAGESGTAVIPLAAKVGPVARVFGSIFVVLAVGMASVHFSLGLFNLAREWVPRQRHPVVRLPRRRGLLVLQEKRRSRIRVGITYMGLSGGIPQFRIDLQGGAAVHREDVMVPDRWDGSALLDRLAGAGGRKYRLVLEVQEAGQEAALLRVDSSLGLGYDGELDTSGVSIADVLNLPDELRALVNWMMRRRREGQEMVSLAEVAGHTGMDEKSVGVALGALVEQGFIREVKIGGKPRYQPCIALKRRRQIPESISEERAEEPQGGVRGAHPLSFVLSERVRGLIALVPMVAVFLLTEWLLFTGNESFSEPLNFLGVIVISLLAGIFPVLLLIAGRRKGDALPGVVYRIMGNPVLLAVVYLLYVVGLFLHGLVIWENPVQRAVALGVGVMMVVVTVSMVRRGVFAPRLVVELREETRGDGETLRVVFGVVAGGRPAEADVRLKYPDEEQHYTAAAGEIRAMSSLQHVDLQVPAAGARELKVWAHRVTPGGESESLPALLEVYDGETRRFDLRLSGGQVVLPLTGQTCRMRILPGGIPVS